MIGDSKGREAAPPAPTVPKGQHRRPCKTCPFTRQVPPGALGGATPEALLGQAAGPFWLPCHERQDLKNEAKRKRDTAVPQCVGAALFRREIRVDVRMPTGLLNARDCVENKSAELYSVFDNPERFLAHHKQVSLLQAAVQLTAITPLEELTRIELEKALRQGWSVPVSAPADKG